MEALQERWKDHFLLGEQHIEFQSDTNFSGQDFFVFWSAGSTLVYPPIETRHG